MDTHQEKRLDIIVLGATGFTGKRTVHRLSELLKSEKLPLTWGIAGRSTKKLKDILLELQEQSGEDYNKIPIIQANIDNVQELEEMTGKARIIINAVGPYRVYGERVVHACLETGTHHIDVSGELQFMESIQLKYHDIAAEKGIYLVSACGFESVPTDLGIVHLQRNFEGTLNSVETYLKIENEDGGLHPGTIAHYTSYESGIYMMTNIKELKSIRSELYKERLPEFEPKLSSKGLFFKNELTNTWCTIFPSPDHQVSLRTQRYFYETDKQRPVQIKTYFSYSSFLQIIGIGIMSFIFLLMSMFSFTSGLLLKHPRFFTWCLISHQGPSEEEQAKTSFNLLLVGEGWSSTLKSNEKFDEPTNKRTMLKVSGKNPAYGTTGLIFALAAVIILTEMDKLPNNGGCYSPGAAFANTSMIETLNKHDIKFEFCS